MSDKDYYSILGISKDASLEEIKKAYKTLAKKYHPDLAGASADPEKFKEISNAYSVLSDTDKRKQYDSYGHDAFSKGYAGNDRQGFSGFSGFDFSDIFSSFMDDDDGGFFSQFSQRRGGRSHRQESLNLVYNLEIDFEKAILGGKEKIEFYKDEECNFCAGTGSKSMQKDVCPTCNGRGRTVTTKRTPFGMFSVENVCSNCKGDGYIIKDPCSKCSGKGYLREKKTLNVEIPSGINTGDVMKLRGQGHNHQGVKGDLFLNISVKPHSFFKRKGSDIYCEIPVTFSDLVLGTTIKINKFKDKIKLKIPSGTEDNTTFKIKGSGASIFNRSSSSGDLYVKVHAFVPQKLDSSLKKKLKDINSLEKEAIKKEIEKKNSDFIEY
ncbi:MAG: molecular chaperone DnaJ [Candidatus ainarchaeum sp.]|nr:molecular chaperone DnaJ [Candidatus ainarchaeum sp.]